MKTLKNTRSAGHSNRNFTQAAGSAADKKKKEKNNFYNPTESVTDVISLANTSCW